MAYTRSTPEKIDDDYLKWITQEFEAIEQEFSIQDMVRLKRLNVAPKKTYVGLIVLADGTNWNPGAGQGFYGYYNGTWNKLG